MRTISPALKAEISNGRIARLLKITCKNGQVFAFTDSDKDLLVDGLNYVPAPGLASVRYTATSNVEISNQEIGAAMVDVPEEDLIGGVFDSATIEASWCSWFDPSLGKVLVFSGTLGEVSWDERGFMADIVSYVKALERNIGWTYTSSCRHELFGSVVPGRLGACTLSASAFTFTGTITSVQTNKWKFTTNLTQADGYFSSGQLTFTSGNNSGLSVTAKKQTGGLIELFIPTAFTTQVGDTFTIMAGCDKTPATCQSKFNNVANFGGFPHIQQDVSFR